MFRVYKLLLNENGEIIHKIPVARCAKLNVAASHARVWSNGWPMGIFEIEADGTEIRVQ